MKTEKLDIYSFRLTWPRVNVPNSGLVGTVTRGHCIYLF